MFDESFEKYKNTKSFYPGYQDEISILIKDIKSLDSVKNNSKITEIKTEMEKQLIDLKVKQQKLKNEYYSEESALEEMFKTDLEKYFDIENNPKKDILYSKAYELGHSSGYFEIYNYYSNLVDLIK